MRPQFHSNAVPWLVGACGSIRTMFCRIFSKSYWNFILACCSVTPSHSEISFHESPYCRACQTFRVQPSMRSVICLTAIARSSCSAQSESTAASKRSRSRVDETNSTVSVLFCSLLKNLLKRWWKTPIRVGFQIGYGRSMVLTPLPGFRN